MSSKNNKNRKPVDNFKGCNNKRKKQAIDRSDFNSTRCSKCRYNNGLEPCYKKGKLLSGLEYTDCVPALIHYDEKRLSAAGIV